MNEYDYGLYTVTISEAINVLSQSYVSLIKNNTPFEKFPSVMLWGPPGVGKSQGVKEIARSIEKYTDKKTVVTDVRLLLFNPVDLRGIPTANADKTLAVWLKPQIFQMDEDENTVNLLFLDEISSAPPSVQAAAYQIVLDRTVGEHKLPDNCIVIAAGNRVSDKSVAFTMPKALSNRLCHFEIRSDTAKWLDWAVSYGIHPYITSYIEYNPVQLMQFEGSGMCPAFATPRSWEMASNILNHISDDINAVYPLLAGCIGHSTTSSLMDWIELCDSLPGTELILKDSPVKLPKTENKLIALRSMLVAYTRINPKKAVIDKAIDIACSLPWSFRDKLLHDYKCIPGLYSLLKQNEVFVCAQKDGLI